MASAANPHAAQSASIDDPAKTSKQYEPVVSHKVTFLGLDVMGYPMAGHLRSAGHDVTVYNRTASKADQWAGEYAAAGAVVTALTPRQAARGADIVFACVGNDVNLRSIVLGEHGAFVGMKPGAVFVDHATASAAVARDARGCPAPRAARHRRAGLGRPGRCGQRRAHRDVRRRAGIVSSASSRSWSTAPKA